MSVTVSGAGNLPAPQMPALPDFQVANTGQSQNFTWINGQASASVTYGFSLTPLKEGTFTIPPIHLQGANDATAPLTLHVLKGDAAAIPSAPGDASTPAAAPSAHGPSAIFIRGSVDKTSVYVGEPVQYTFRLYNRVPLFSRPNYQPPETSGFWSEDLPPQRSFQTTVNNIPYNVTELRTALFPTSAGTAHIGPAKLAVTIENLGSDPFSQDFFAQFFGRAEEKTLSTEPLTVHVKPLPNPKPAGFGGAVGHFTLNAAIDKNTVAVNDPVTLTVTIAGEGNVKSLPNLTLPTLTNARMFDPTSATSIEKKDGHVEGSKMFKTVLIPTASGDLKIPSIPFVYFDPTQGAYKHLESRALNLHVTPGTGGNTVTAPMAPTASGGSVAEPAQIQRLADDIRYIKTPARLPAQGAWWVETTTFWVVHLLAVVLLVGFAGFRLYQKHFLANSAWNRFKTAADRAYAGARKAEALADKSELKAAAEHLADTYQRYLADKLTLPTQGLALRQVQEAMRRRGLIAHNGEKVRNLWETLDLYEFAPAQIRVEDVRQSLATFRHVVEELEQEIPWNG